MGGSRVLGSKVPLSPIPAGPSSSGIHLLDTHVTVRLVLFITRDGELVGSAGVLSPNVTVNLGYFFHFVCRIDTDT
jgi:hypothetical protein